MQKLIAEPTPTREVVEPLLGPWQADDTGSADGTIACFGTGTTAPFRRMSVSYRASQIAMSSAMAPMSCTAVDRVCR